tara:strand:- start:283 stop:705 length:423 start_codon:yes stop_codon:yes gene_type:complete
MIDKTIHLTGEYPSDFKPGCSILEIQKHFDAFDFDYARMIGGSKWEYSDKHRGDLIVFNANVLMPGYGKVWYGDLNLTEDYLVLREIAETLNTDLYVLWESDGRFGKEKEPLNELLDKAVWNTTEDKPTKDWYKKKMNSK